MIGRGSLSLTKRPGGFNYRERIFLSQHIQLTSPGRGRLRFNDRERVFPLPTFDLDIRAPLMFERVSMIGRGFYSPNSVELTDQYVLFLFQ